MKPPFVALGMNYYAHIKRTSAMSSFGEIDLPTPILVQAVGFTGFGLYSTIFRRMPWRSQSTTISPQIPLALRNNDTTSILGAAYTALDLAYLRTSCSNLGKSNVARQRTRAIVHICAIFGQAFGDWEGGNQSRGILGACRTRNIS